MVTIGKGRGRGVDEVDAGSDGFSASLSILGGLLRWGRGDCTCCCC